MILFELDDFDYWVDNSVTGGQGVEVFSPMFVYLIHWAMKNNKLDKNLTQSITFSADYSKLLKGGMSFSSFVCDILDGKLADSYFISEVRKFLYDYIEYDGYTTDLTNYYKLNVWELPCELKETDGLFKLIDKSYKNYEKNKISNPDIISFD